MGFINNNVDGRHKTAQVQPEGDYLLTCITAKYTFKDANAPQNEANIKGAFLTFQFTTDSGETGETRTNFNLSHPSEQVRSMAFVDLGRMSRSMGMSINPDNGKIIKADGKEVQEISEYKKLKGWASIGVGKHYQTGEHENTILRWLYSDEYPEPAQRTKEQKPEPAEVGEDFDDDIPF